MLENIISWLYHRRIANHIIVWLYFAFILLMHDPLVRLSVWIMESLTRHTYDKLVFIIVFTILIGLVVYFVRKLMSSKSTISVWFLVATIVLIFFHFQVLFVMNIEVIHSFQFGILAILIFPLTGRLGYAVFFATLLGVFDELYQYRWLYPDKNDYLDFNDMILNQLGAGFAIVLLSVTQIANAIPAKVYKWYRSPVWISAVTLTIVIAVLFRLSVIQCYSDEQSAPWLVLNKATGPDEHFWRASHTSDIVFHVIQPLEGVIIMILLLAFYFLFDEIWREKMQRTVTEKNVDNHG